MFEAFRNVSRRQLLNGAIGLASLPLLSKVLTSCSTPKSDLSVSKANKGKAPNVLAIVVDDLRPQLGCYGRAEMISPNIDRLAAEATLFEQVYCQVPICGASRASFLSGLRASRTLFGSAYNATKDKDAPDLPSLPATFKQNGYTTISLGKVYHQQDDDRDAWSEQPWRPSGMWAESMYITPEGRQSALENPGQFKLGPAFERVNVTDDAYADGKITDKAIAKLKGFAKSKERFFLAVGLTKPHLPFNVPERYWAMYDHDKINLADNPFRPPGTPDIAFSNWEELRDYQGIPKEGPLSEEMTKTMIHGYYAATTYADTLVGRILAELDRLKLTEDTIVVLWGDHGWHLGEQGMWCKHTNFESSLWSPLIVRVPGKAAGQRVTGLTEFVDLYPSLCELCGLELPSHLEGDSFVRLLDQPDLAWKQAAFSHYGDGDSIKVDGYRYTEWRSDQGDQYARMLFDHVADLAENNNIAEDPDRAELVAQLSQMLDQGRGWETLRMS
jgi:arylsulfatase A-like enzyme